MKAEELKKILDDHKNWLENKAGQRANLRGAYLRGADLRGAIVPMYCKWGTGTISGKIKIGCVTKTPEKWEEWLASDKEYETKRGTAEFKQIEAVIRAHIAYLNVLK